MIQKQTKIRKLTVINASAAVTLLEERPEKIQALSGIRTHDLCDASAVLSQLSGCQSFRLHGLSRFAYIYVSLGQHFGVQAHTYQIFYVSIKFFFLLLTLIINFTC